MYRKYIIEKKDLDNLPPSYKEVAINYSSNYNVIQKKVNEINKLKKKINSLNNDVEKLLYDTKRIYNQLKFIKKNYIPRIYIKSYTKNNKYQKYINIVVNYFGVSKTIYLGKREMVLTTFNIDSSLSEKKIKQNILTSISPFIFKSCRDVKSKFDFLDLSITSKAIFTNIISINTNDSFSNYLKGFELIS
jgi:hypothetical protein